MAATPTAWERAQTYAGNVEDVIDWPIDDAAAVIGVETAWLAGMLLAMKILAAGLYKEFVSSEPRKRR